MKSLFEFLINKPLRKYDDDIIDLGLPSGNLWCNKNVGAKDIYDAGEYFAWGETKTKSPSTFNKENYTIDWNGKIPNSLPDNYDAAYVNSSGKYVMPTKQDCKELIEYTTIKIIQDNKHNYLELTSNINGNKLIFPENYYYSDHYIVSSEKNAGVILWIKTLNREDMANTLCLSINNKDLIVNSWFISYGLPVRGIIKK